MDPIALTIFSSRLASICEEMGATLKNAALSPNIKERLDYSCAIFDREGHLLAQAAHIPVHLGSMAYAMRDIVEAFEWYEGDALILNDPYKGGTHLPDVTIVVPCFIDEVLTCFIASRAHHANIGADSPGSMPVSSSIEEEGLLISAQKLVNKGQYNDALLTQFNHALGWQTLCDFKAQLSANYVGLKRLVRLIPTLGDFSGAVCALNHYGNTIATEKLKLIPDGVYSSTQYMDDDGFGNVAIPICVTIKAQSGQISVDFDGTSGEVKGNINAPYSVAASALWYVFKCFIGADTPNCHGVYKSISITFPPDSLVNPSAGAAVAAGNVETSQRIVDAVIDALSQCVDNMPAQSCGTMNNIAFGHHDSDDTWDYYETLGGGGGASKGAPGISGRQCHMTNTLNTPVEAIELHYPLAIDEYAIATGTGGQGRQCGGDGVVRTFRLLQDATVTLITERRVFRPLGAQDGCDGAAGKNYLNDEIMPGKFSKTLKAGDRVKVETPGGGGYGSVA